MGHSGTTLWGRGLLGPKCFSGQLQGRDSQAETLQLAKVFYAHKGRKNAQYDEPMGIHMYINTYVYIKMLTIIYTRWDLDGKKSVYYHALFITLTWVFSL